MLLNVEYFNNYLISLMKHCHFAHSPVPPFDSFDPETEASGQYLLDCFYHGKVSIDASTCTYYCGFGLLSTHIIISWYLYIYSICMLDVWLSHQGTDELRLNATLYLFTYTQIPVHKLTFSLPWYFLPEIP